MTILTKLNGLAQAQFWLSTPIYQYTSRRPL